MSKVIELFSKFCKIGGKGIPAIILLLIVAGANDSAKNKMQLLTRFMVVFGVVIFFRKMSNKECISDKESGDLDSVGNEVPPL